MATSYITLNSLQYYVKSDGYSPQDERAKLVDLSLTGKTMCQLATQSLKKWQFVLIVPFVGDATWGDIEDLRAARNLETVSFTDHHGNNHTVYVISTIPEHPRQNSPVIDGSGAKYWIPVELVKVIT